MEASTEASQQGEPGRPKRKAADLLCGCSKTDFISSYSGQSHNLMSRTDSNAVLL